MSFKRLFLLFLFIFSAKYCHARLDTSKYIGIDEISAGMKGYCLTVYKGTEIEKFDIEVLSVVENAKPGIFSQGGKNTILVMGLDKRFKHTGPVQGCSGSPVFIDGRIAGALAVGFTLSKDPLYGVTPIEEMIEYTTNPHIKETYQRSNTLNIDYSKPLTITEIGMAYEKSLKNYKHTENNNFLTIPLVSSLGQSEVGSFNDIFKNTGLKLYSGSASMSLENLDTEITPGASVACPLVFGDISISAIGTATAVEGEKVFAFGHSFLGEGNINLPMANGYVHTVVSNIVSSFKLGQAGKIVGALKGDTMSCVYGEIGQKAPTIDLNISVNKDNYYKQSYSCKAAVHPRITPILVNVAMMGAINMHSKEPLHHQVTYDITIKTKNFENISFSNFIADAGAGRAAYELLGILAALMDNPYKQVEIESVDVSFNIKQANKLSIIEKMEISDFSPKPGEKVSLNIYTDTYLKGKSKISVDIDIPQDIQPGQYQIHVGGGDSYESFVRQNSPHKFMVNNIDDLFELFRLSTSTKKNKLYVFMEIPAGGITIDSKELGNLPMTKTMVLVDPKRTSQLSPYKNWIVKQLDVNRYIINDMVIAINIEE